MSLSRAEVIAYLESLSSLELGEFIDALQRRLDIAVTPAPRVHVTMGAPLPIDDHDDLVLRVVVTAIGPRKVQVLKALRQRLPLPLHEAVALLEALPAVVVAGTHADDAHALAELLREAGATVTTSPARQ